MNRICISDNIKIKLAAAIVEGCDSANRITKEHMELFSFRKNILGHLRSSSCVPFMIKKYFGEAVHTMRNSNDSYSYVEIECDGYIIKIAHEPSSYAEYREVYSGCLFPENEVSNNTLTLRYRTNKDNEVTDIWLDGEDSSLPIPVELASVVSEDEEFYEAVAEKMPTFKSDISESEVL